MKKYLIVEDDELSRKILEDVMSEFAECDSAPDGNVGFKLFEQAILMGQPYDLVCSDVVMPGMDGHDMVCLMRALEESLPVVDYMRSKIFMISSSDSIRDMTQAILENDCDDYIVKPFRRESLKSLLQKYNLIEHHNEP